MANKQVIIIGAGPAGLTAAYELLRRTDLKPIIFETDDQVGGLAKTFHFQNNLIDLGPHRFFTKSQRVMDFWQSLMPFSQETAVDSKNVLLKIKRLTRILFLGRFFDYPITLSKKTLINLGSKRIVKIMISYLQIRTRPIRGEANLRDFYVNRFGRELYDIFFKDYTKKVWGVDCAEIPADWGAQRVKGLSVKQALSHALKNILGFKNRKMETSLIESFYYPKFGAGQMYEVLAEKITALGGEIYLNHRVDRLKLENNKIIQAEIMDLKTQQVKEFAGDYFFSTMPVKELVQNLSQGVPKNIEQIASGLVYRDYILVALLLKNISFNTQAIKDNWIYIQEREMKMGRLDFVNNFSLSMLADLATFLVGAEYFCHDGDWLWQKTDNEIVKFAFDELLKIKAVAPEDLLTGQVYRQLKAYPAYFGSYDKFDLVKEYLDKIDNLFLIGRNGMHHYNNMDHSILTAMTAVDNIVQGIKTKENIWSINTEEEYHEQK
ncbi:MAG: NAD(P)/FAD-dependent oxidoreductase [Candidatus Buchananbacteria bacterium]